MASVSIATVQASIPQSGPPTFASGPLHWCLVHLHSSQNPTSVRCVAEQTLTKEVRDNCPDEHHHRLPHLQHSHGENSSQLSGLPTSVDRATRLDEVPHFTCECDQGIKRDCMERLVTSPRRGTSQPRSQDLFPSLGGVGQPPSQEKVLGTRLGTSM